MHANMGALGESEIPQTGPKLMGWGELLGSPHVRHARLPHPGPTLKPLSGLSRTLRAFTPASRLPACTAAREAYSVFKAGQSPPQTLSSPTPPPMPTSPQATPPSFSVMGKKMTEEEKERSWAWWPLGGSAAIVPTSLGCAKAPDPVHAAAGTIVIHGFVCHEGGADLLE